MDAAAWRSFARATVADRWGAPAWWQPAYRAIAAEVGLAAGAFLDLGAGTGWTCIHVAAGKPELDAVGLLADEGARRRADRNRGRRLNCTFKVADPTRIAWPDGTFDAALAVAVVRDWHDPDAIAAEVHRVLAPGGRWLVYDPLPDAPIPPAWLDRKGPWPPTPVVRAWMRRHAASDAGWAALKAAIKARFGGGEEGTHGCFRRILARKSG